MKWLYIIPFVVVLLACAWVGTELQDLHREVATLRVQNKELRDIIRVRKWVDTRHFSKLISNVQWLTPLHVKGAFSSRAPSSPPAEPAAR